MADSSVKRRGDPHDWNPLENYVYLHRKHFDKHQLVDQQASSLEFIRLQNPRALHDILIVEGRIICTNGLSLEIRKAGDLEKTGARRVRMRVYRYHAHFPGGHNVLRYDNGHYLKDDEYHRHEFDVATGEEISRKLITRLELPVMNKVFDELMAMLPPSTLVASREF